LFSFNYKKNLKYFGAIWGGIAITAITYFILIKGAKGASFMSDEAKDFIIHNALPIIGASFVAWTLLLQLLSWLTKLNILKFVVLVGTFALAMAFAGNDLVNFIGVPLAGYESYTSFMANPGAEPDAFLMTDLTGKVKTPTLFLLIAGLIMVVTLWTSKKARSVTKTEINLARQDAGYERFGSSSIARSLVRGTDSFASRFKKLLPAGISKRIDKQFDQSEYKSYMSSLGDEAPYFDMIRASVNLVVASILISFATSLKLPLSTTYVTFMVAMGTSLSDKAWGRESAVYRITGVFSVIGGWFFTAFSAFTVAFLVAMAIKFGGFIAVMILVALAVFFVYRTHTIHKRRTAESEEEETLAEDEVISGSAIVAKCETRVTDNMVKVSDILASTFEGLSKSDLKKLRKVHKDLEKVNKKIKGYKDNVDDTIKHLEDSSIETGHYYVQVIDYLREIAHSISFITKPCYDHVDNHHKELLPVQLEELLDMTRMIRNLIGDINESIRTNDYSVLDKIVEDQTKTLKFIDTSRKKQVKRIKANEVGTRNSMLFLAVLSESKNLLLQSVNLIKAQRDFSNFANENGDLED